MDTVPAPSEKIPVAAAALPTNDVSDNSAIKVSTSGPTATTPALTPTTASSPAPAAAAALLEADSQVAKDKLEHAKQLIEEQRKLKEAEEERQARERELNRRKYGKASQGLQKWQKEQDFKELKESIRRDKMEDQAARQRIQIASDRAEQANKFTTPPTPNPTPTQATTPTAVNTSGNLEISRIQFRIPNGETSTQSFESSDRFATVQAYVKLVVVKGTGIKDFTSLWLQHSARK